MKVVNSTNQEFRSAALNLTESRRLVSQAKKLEERAKSFIKSELLERGVNVSKLLPGETIIVKLDKEECIRLTVKSSSRIDIDKLAADYPSVEKDCRRDFPCVYYDSLIDDQEDVLTQKRRELQETIKKIKELQKHVVGNTNTM